MSWFKRLCMFLFGLAGLVSLTALSLTWVGPWTAKARSMLELSWYLMVLEICVLIAAVGLLACLLVAIFYPRNPKETIVAKVEGGEITVTRHAIVSQVRHIIESDGVCKASSIRVSVRKRGNVRVNVRVRPFKPIDIIAYGERLYDRLSAGLAEVCGDSVKSINVVFAEPAQGADQAQGQNGIGGMGTAGVDDVQSESSEGISVNPSTFAAKGDQDEATGGFVVPASTPETSSTDETSVVDAAGGAGDGATTYSWEASDEAGSVAQDTVSDESGEQSSIESEGV